MTDEKNEARAGQEERAVLTVNGEYVYSVLTSDAKGLEVIKEMARDHRDRRGHDVTLRREVWGIADEDAERSQWSLCGCC
jgi:hypothetical protein